jgi:ABC-2 type transport system permease protein
MFAVSIFSVTLLTFAIAGLAIGFGTLYPRFESENAAQIPTSFGGLLFMMTAVIVIGAVIVLEARPVYSFVGAKAFGGTADSAAMVVGFSGAAVVCLAGTFLPLRMALRRLELIER